MTITELFLNKVLPKQDKNNSESNSQNENATLPISTLFTYSSMPNPTNFPLLPHYLTILRSIIASLIALTLSNRENVAISAALMISTALTIQLPQLYLERFLKIDASQWSDAKVNIIFSGFPQAIAVFTLVWITVNTLSNEEGRALVLKAGELAVKTMESQASNSELSDEGSNGEVTEDTTQEGLGGVKEVIQQQQQDNDEF
eukprot:CAMPEP_0118637760 /NCGR_PEP_ID=MMETSP0785-20121206/3322_1 /TAXON_ID=91992 /ORGANISM="Bolidomonas pacifica, Strain CCMP 1866" /LENGTH=201 /DNA_ID=CAMNT_0006528963 /DNA_START=20 /DNA_END=625 /DNA_ORIENTATION=-